MATYITNNMVGEMPAGTEFDGGLYEEATLNRLLGLNAISLISGEAAKEAEEVKDTPKLSEARKAAKDATDRADKAEGALKTANDFIDKVKAHVDSLPADQKKAFQDAVNKKD